MMITTQNWLYWPTKKIDQTVKKLTFCWPFKLKTRNVLLVCRVLAKKHVIQAYCQKIDFIEKTCPINYNFVNYNYNFSKPGCCSC